LTVECDGSAVAPTTIPSETEVDQLVDAILDSDTNMISTEPLLYRGVEGWLQLELGFDLPGLETHQ
jgi:hypothetical protein